MSIDTLYADGIEDHLKRWAANPGPEPSPGFSITAFIGAGGRGISAGELESAGFAADILSAFGTAAAASDSRAGGMFSRPTDAERKQEAQARDRMLKSDAFDLEAGNTLRQRAEEIAPDPVTAHHADQVIFGLTRFATKAINYVGTAGPLGAIPLGIDEAQTVTQNLRAKGVDTETATKAGATQGAFAAAGAVLPLGGKTVAQTAALVGAGGPGAYIAQESLVRDILAKAGYDDQASLHNPFDPLGLALSTIIPGGFGALHMRAVGKRTAALEAGTVPLGGLSDKELRGLKYNDARLDAYAAQAAEANGVPPAILLAIKNAGEKSGPTAKSPAGAVGVMQFMEATAKEMGLADRTDPLASIDAAARYLRKLHDAYGSWDAVATHYNGGGAQAAIVRGGGKPTFPETAAYLERVKKYVAEHTAETAAKDPATVDAARVAALNEVTARSLPDTPRAYENMQRASDIVAESGGRAAEREIDPAIPQAGSLTAGEREIERRLSRKLANDLNAAIEEYAQRPDSMGGKVLNTDIARELSADYLADRTRSAAVHEPASWFIKQLYERKLASIQPGDAVLFTSGGTGAGKTTAIESVPAVKALQEHAAIVYDTNMNSLDSAVSKIEKALQAGADVQIVHVQRDPVEALVKGALPRAMRQEKEFGSGRTVPVSEHAKTHMGAAKVIQELADRYANDPRVDIRVVDNTNGKGGAREADLGFIRSFDYNGVEGNLNAALEAERQAGRISEAVYSATANREGTRAAAGGRDGARPERVDSGRTADRATYPDSAEVNQPEPAAPASGERPNASLDNQLARKIADEQPDLQVVLPGSDERISVKEALARISEEQKQDAHWADLVRVAAECALSAG